MPRARRTCVELIRSDDGRDALCPALAELGGNRCDAHQKAYEARRGSRQERGYDARHDRIRKRLMRTAIGAICPLCDELMDAEQELHLDHTIPLWKDKNSIPDRIVHGTCNMKRPKHESRS